MYVLPIVAIVILGVIAVAWSPIFAVVFAAIFVLGFFAYAGLRPRADEVVEPPTGSAEKYEDDEPTGAWGEPRP